MPEEERKAIEVCKELIAENSNDLLNCWDSGEEAKQAISTILYLIEKQQEEIEKKDKIIDELEYIFYNYQLCEYEITDYRYRKCEYIGDDETPPCKDCIKNYFERKVENESR